MISDLDADGFDSDLMITNSLFEIFGKKLPNIAEYHRPVLTVVFEIQIFSVELGNTLSMHRVATLFATLIFNYQNDIETLNEKTLVLDGLLIAQRKFKNTPDNELFSDERRLKRILDDELSLNRFDFF